MLFLKLALQVLTAGLVFLTSTLDYVAHDKRTRRFNHLRVGLYFVAGLSLVASLAITVNDDIAKKEETAALRDELTAIQTAVRRTSDAVTGGESFPYVNIVGQRVLLINAGRDPLYDISVRMWDPSDYKNVITPAEFEALDVRAMRFAVSTMAPDVVLEVAKLQLPITPVKTFAATIIARNGTFTEELVMRRVDGGWRPSYRIFRGLDQSKSVPLLERVDPTFPRDQYGVPRWDAP